LNRLFLISSAIALVGVGLGFFSYNYSMKLFIGNNLVSVGLLFWAGVYQSYRGFRPAYFFTVSWLAVLCGHVALVLTAIGLLPYNFITSFGAFVGSGIEVALLSLALGDKMRFAQQQDKRHIALLYKDLQKRNEEILNLNQHLEEMVEEKTRDILSIMKNIRQGIFTIGSDLCIKGDTSEFLQEVFDEKDLQGRNAMDVIFTHSEVSMDVRNQTETALLAILHEDVMVFSMNENLLCREILQQKEGKILKVLEVDWNPIIKDNLVNRILVTIKDVTEQRLLQRQHDEREKEVQMFEQILSVKLASFKKFAQSTAYLLEECKTAITSEQNELERLRKVYANLHTIKGASRTVGLDFLSEIVHRTENELQDAILQKKVINRADLTSALQRVHEMFQSYMTIFIEKLGAHMTSPERMEVSRELVHEMFDELQVYLDQARHDEERTRKVLAEQCIRLQKILFPTLHQLIVSMAPIVQSAAASLGKLEPKLHIEGGDTLLATESCEEMLQHSFIHIFRNSIDHGIETDSERIKAGKQAQGIISIVISMQPGFVRIAISDDGKGINLAAIREKAARLNLLPAHVHADASAVAEIIFHSGFSTKDQVSAMSGRGAGMDAVRAYVEKFGGKAEIELGADKSQGYRDFQLILKLPLNLVLSARPQGMELAS
jgi:HPt (histidine-containing phosphotransfer) domain-containing protein